MFIIVEGPDGAGKSTAVQALTMELWRHARGTVLVNPKRSPNQHALVEYKERLDFYQPGSGVDLILDRSWYSEQVYGPIWRGCSGVSLDDQLELEQWALAKGAVILVLDEDDEVLIERVRGERLEDDEDAQHMDESLIKEYAFQYRSQRSNWRLPKVIFPPGYDFRPWPVIRHAELYERFALEAKEA